MIENTRNHEKNLLDSQGKYIRRLEKLVDTDKILFEAAITTGFWLEPRDFFEVFLEGSDEVIDILTDEDFQDEFPSFFEKYFRHLEDRQIELHGTILIDPRDAGRGWCDI